MRSLWLAAAAVGVAASGAAAQTLHGSVQSVAFTGPITGRTVNFNIYLPEGYAAGTQSYPVVYHLHGIGGNQGGPQNTTVPASFESALTQGVIGPVIVVFPNGYNDSWWADSMDGAKPAETDVALQLVPYVDSHYRTIGSLGSRVIEGFSMGGFGATKFYSKFPDLFVCCVEYDGAIVTWADMLTYHAAQASAIFGNSQAYFDLYSPWTWATTNAPTLRTSTQFRMIAGALVQGNQRFRDFLIGLQIPVEYVATGCPHDIGCLFTAQGPASAAFIAARLELGCKVDANGNGSIEPADVGVFVNTWFTSLTSGGPAGDFDGNGVVNPADVAGFVGAWFTALTQGC